jgi:hypothetical protein
MRVNETARDTGNEVEHAAGFASLQDDIIQGECGRVRFVRTLESRLQHQALVRGEFAGQHVPDAVQHLFRRHVGEKAEAAAVDAEQGQVPASRQLPGIEHCPVSADSNDQVGGISKFRLGNARRRYRKRHIFGRQNLDARLSQVVREHGHRLGYARVFVATHDRYLLEHRCHVAFAFDSSCRSACKAIVTDP